ncbi:MAG: helix-turn-helix transcriptional regulator [Pseudomonadota bacterium]
MSDRVHNTVLRIYDAAADSTLWPDVLQEFADQIDAVGCIVFEWKGAIPERQISAPIASSYYDPKAIEKYILECFDDEARDQDIFEQHSLRDDTIDLIEDDVISTTLDDLKARPNVAILQKLGILHRAAGLLNKDNTAIARFSVQLANTRGRLDADERMHLSRVLPHIAKSLDLGRPAQQLAAERRSMLAAMDHLTIGVCILDMRGKLVSANEEFSRQLEAYPVFQLSHGGALRITDPVDQRRFETLKDHALNHGQFGGRPRKEAISTQRDTFLCIEVTPLNRSEEIGSKLFGGYILFSTDTSLPVRSDTAPIKRAFQLSDAEASLVDMIADGLTNRQIAARRGRSVTTINTQVKAILAKTHCATRTQFVRLLMSFGSTYVKEG